jgi:hypothetical protein
MLSEWSPGCRAAPPRLRALRGRSDHRPLKDSRMKVSSASTIPLKLRVLVGGRSAQKPMPPAKRRRRMHPAKLGRFRQAFAFDHRPGVVEPALPFVQMRHRRLGERIEGARATLAAEPRKPMRASPADDRPSRAMRTALARHSLMAARSQSIRTTTPLRAFIRRPAGRGGLGLSPPRPAHPDSPRRRPLLGVARGSAAQRPKPRRKTHRPSSTQAPQARPQPNPNQ